MIKQMLRVVIHLLLPVMWTSAASAENPSLVGKWRSGIISEQFVDTRVNHEFGEDGSYKRTMLMSINFDPSETRGINVAFEGRYKRLENDKINFELERLYETALDETTVRDNNKHKRCGLSDWRIGVAKETTGLNCDGNMFSGGTELEVL